MSRHALRRLLWIGPILIAVTLASFALLAYIPDPASDPAVVASLSREQASELARTHFLDLPRFFNDHPVDLVRRVERALEAIERPLDASKAELARAELGRLGGAALPYVLARLDARPPDARARIALALRPVAERMGMLTTDAADPERAVALWMRFWSDRAIDFRPGNAHRVVARLAAHSTSAREADLLELDTYALEQLMRALDEITAAPLARETGERLQAMRRLVSATAHVTNRDDVIGDDASPEEHASCVRRWQEWWLVHRADFIAYDGPSRVLASLADTQYGRWAEKVAVLGFGIGTDGVPILHKLEARAPLTLGLVGAALLCAYWLAVVVAVWNEVVGTGAFDTATMAGALALLVLPVACLATWLSSRAGALIVAVPVLACGMIAGPLAQMRGLLAEVRDRDYVRAARARGFTPLRIVAHHAVRNAVLPLTALGSVELPTALGGAFVVEKTLRLPGLGEETARAVQTHDVAWLVGFALVTALLVTLASIASDLLVATLDPRLTRAAVRHESTRS